VTTVQDARRRKAREAAHRQSATAPTVLSSLLAVEDALGWVPPEAVEEVAAFTGATMNDVWGVVSYYTNFRIVPPCEHAVEICWGLSCHLLGGKRLATAAMERLGLSGEGDTADGKVSFRFNTCLGACSQAPAVSLDHKVRGPVRPEQLRELLEPLLGGPALSHEP